MTKAKTTKRALALSLAALVVCVAMLAGSTYAWFTDSVTSTGNTVKAGNLEVDLVDADGNSLSGQTMEFVKKEGTKEEPVLWEPGSTYYLEPFFVVNKGTLDIKYNVVINGVYGNAKLLEVIDFYLSDDEKLDSGDISINEMETAYTDIPLLAGKSSDATYLIAHMKETADNEYQDLTLEGISVTVYATQLASESDSFGNQYDKDAEYPPVDVEVTPANVAGVDFSDKGRIFTLRGDFGALSVDELGEGSVISFDGATVAALNVTDNAVLSGKASIEKITVSNNSTEPISLTLSDAVLDIAGEISVKNTLGKSVLNIENSDISAATVFVGAHMTNTAATAEFNVTDSYVSCEENGLGSTVAVWGASGVDAKIYDSEIHTYSRGWHQSEDANDNSLTFQASQDHLNVDIKRSNMHLYGARSIINARVYGSAEPEVNFTVDESLIWVVTKSNHGEETIPVWGGADITDTAVLFTKNVYNKDESPAIFKSFVYGNPVIHGNYSVVTQCGWAADIALADGQTVTFAKDANVSVYDGAAEVSFVLTGSAKVVVEKGATLTNVGIKAAEGYTLDTAESNGNTVYTVTAD